jgi:hypothetical protein
MNPLSENWITEKTLDFEYKKYLLLAWLQSVESDFRTVRLYPALSELIAHYRNATLLSQNKSDLSSQFPRKITGIEKHGLQLEFEALMHDDESMIAIERLLNFSIPKFEEWMKEGRAIYEFIEGGIELSPVGIIPLRTSEGYLLLSQNAGDTRVYSYEMTILRQAQDSVYDNPDAGWRSLRTAYISSWKRNFTNTFESIKAELIRTITVLPNPAVFVAISERDIPMEPTFLPIAKRMLLREISVSRQ